MSAYAITVLLAALWAGAGCGLMGVYVVGLRLPFVGICISHAAMAGAVLSLLLGASGPWLGIVLSGLMAMMLACIRPQGARIDPNVAMAVLFSLTLGLTFLGIGLIQDSRSEVLGLLWGNILFVRPTQAVLIAAVTLAFAGAVWFFKEELKVLLFSRSLAEATGLHQTTVYALFLGLCGITLAVDLPLVGGLMIFSLVTNPAAAAYQICHSHGSVVITSVIFGLLSAGLGVLISYGLNWPTGASIVLVSALIFAGAVGCRQLQTRRD